MEKTKKVSALPVLEIKSSILIEKPLETVALHLSDPASLADWIPLDCEMDIAEYIPFNKISLIERLPRGTIQRTLLFEPINSHGTRLTYVEEHQLKNLLALITGPIVKSLLQQTLKERLLKIKKMFEEKKKSPFGSPPGFFAAPHHSR